jgi:uncharacterized integral membrane protein
MLRFLLLLPLLLLIVLFVVSNTAPVEVGLWPTGVSVRAPLALWILGAMAVAFFLGALATWLPALGARRRARRAEARIAALDQEILALKTRLAEGPTLLPPAG